MELNPYKSPWKYFLQVIPHLGENQEYLRVAFIDDIISRFKLNEKSDFYFINNLSGEEWENSSWLRWINENHEKNVSLNFFVNKVGSKKTIGELLKKNIINVKLIEKPFSVGFALSTSPQELWFEGDRSGKKNQSYECYFTSKPYKKVWTKIKSFFDDVSRQSRSLSIQSELFLE